MARLNDPPQPAGESLDTLKRRFVRQNRELARVNSTQSVRIRNLEREVSRLLGENVCLREQIINLHHKLENDCGRIGWDKVDMLKQKLESRLMELGGVLLELSEVQGKAAKECPVKLPSTSQKSPRSSPNQRQWKTKLSLSDLTGEADSRLPPILEDIDIPNKASDNELLEKFAETGNFADSPELGPPPVALFEERDAIRSNPMPAKPARHAEESVPTAFPNLEARKKRRESFLQRGSTGQSDAMEYEGRNMASEAKPISTHPSKLGAKRKFNVREGDQRKASINEEDFPNNNAKSNSYGETVESGTDLKISPMAPGSVTSSRVREQRKPEKIKDINFSSTRRVLGPKSVNSDPQSPAKLTRTLSKDKGLQRKDDVVKRIRDRRYEKDRPNIDKVEKIVKDFENSDTQNIANISLPPKTPAIPGLDLFSPSTSDPLEQRPESQDTPPPPDLGPNTGTGSFGRTSRRSKGSVSYTEPNLRDKMRRPTKDLIDAVGTEDKLKQDSFDKVVGVPSSNCQLEGMRIKQEDDDDEGSRLVWKTKPIKESKSQQQRLQAEKTSPLSQKANLPAADLPASVMTDRRRRASSLVRKDDDGIRKEQGSGAGTVIAALSGATYRKKNGAEVTETKDEGIVESDQETEGRISVFDFTSSSPEHPGGENIAQQGLAKPLRVARRHSSVSTFSEHGRGPITISRRRREAVIADKGDPNKANESEMPSATSMTVPDVTKEASQGSIGRSERAANRRRSMVV